MKKYIFLIFLISTFMNAQNFQNIIDNNSSFLKYDKFGNSNLFFFNKKADRFKIDNKYIVFIIDEKQNKFILEKLYENFNTPFHALDDIIWEENNNKNFNFERFSSKDFVFNKSTLFEYLIIIWKISDFQIIYYKPNSNINNDYNLIIEIRKLD